MTNNRVYHWKSPWFQMQNMPDANAITWWEQDALLYILLMSLVEEWSQIPSLCFQINPQLYTKFIGVSLSISSQYFLIIQRNPKEKSPECFDWHY